MAGWPPGGRWAADDPSPQGARRGRSLETGSAFPCVVRGLVRGLRVVSSGELWASPGGRQSLLSDRQERPKPPGLRTGRTSTFHHLEPYV